MTPDASAAEDLRGGECGRTSARRSVIAPPPRPANGENLQMVIRPPYTNGMGFTVATSSEKAKRGTLRRAKVVRYIHQVEVVTPGKPADLAGLKIGDEITQIGGGDVEKVNHGAIADLVRAALAANGPLVLTLIRPSKLDAAATTSASLDMATMYRDNGPGGITIPDFGQTQSALLPITKQASSQSLLSQSFVEMLATHDNLEGSTSGCSQTGDAEGDDAATSDMLKPKSTHECPPKESVAQAKSGVADKASAYTELSIQKPTSSEQIQTNLRRDPTLSPTKTQPALDSSLQLSPAPASPPAGVVGSLRADANLGPRRLSINNSSGSSYRSQRGGIPPSNNKVSCNGPSQEQRPSGTKNKAPAWQVATPVCTACGEKAYSMESVVADSRTLHKKCFRCTECNKMLSLGSYAALEGDMFCKPCFKKLFRLKGNYAEGFGREQHKMKWVGQIS